MEEILDRKEQLNSRIIHMPQLAHFLETSQLSNVIIDEDSLIPTK